MSISTITIISRLHVISGVSKCPHVTFDNLVIVTLHIISESSFGGQNNRAASVEKTSGLRCVLHYDASLISGFFCLREYEL